MNKPLSEEEIARHRLEPCRRPRRDISNERYVIYAG